MIATAPSIAAPASKIARSPAPATPADLRAASASRVARAVLCVLLAWSAAVLAASSYLGAWKRAQPMRSADPVAAAAASLEHP